MIHKININKLRKTRFSKLAAFWSLGLFQHGAYLAGGSIRTLLRDETVNDFDVFFSTLVEDRFTQSLPPLDDPFAELAEPEIPTYVNVEAVKRILEKERFKLIFACPEGKMFSYAKGDVKIQLILEIHGPPNQIIQSFDFGACCAAFDGEYIYFSKNFVRDVKTQRLSINQVTYPVATIKRLAKYQKKGYNINDACLQFMHAVSGLSFSDENLRLYID